MLLFTGCVNKHGVSAQYYSDCTEYYDMQGYYHKKCGEDDIITYKEAKEETLNAVEKIKNKITELAGKEPPKKKPKPNVW